jgi:hypothetical protein
MSREPSTDPTRSQPPAGFAALESIEAPPALRSAVQQLADEASAGRRPAAVHRSRWDALRRLRPGESPRLRWAGAGALAAIATAVVVLAAVLLSGNTQRAGTPTVLQTSRVALAAATLPAPGEDPRRPSRLALAVDGVSFPYWGGRTGWETAGVRVDSLAGRRVTTVFYAGAHGGARIGYAIVAGPALPVPAGGRTVWRGGVRFTVLSAGGPGVAGASGAAGTNGAAGTSHTAGTSGAASTSHTAGTSGAASTSHAAGTSGAASTSHTAGTSGAASTSHTAGTSGAASTSHAAGTSSTPSTSGAPSTSATAGATVVTWREGGHTCVLAARAVPPSTLMGLVS